MIAVGEGKVAASIQAFTSPCPASCERSLKSVSFDPRLSGKVGIANSPLTASAAAVAFVNPGLPSVAWSSSAAMMIFISEYFEWILCATGNRLPASKATATESPVA